MVTLGNILRADGVLVSGVVLVADADTLNISTWSAGDILLGFFSLLLDHRVELLEYFCVFG
jgi:hypothetical protein